jgi:hypothetical protein
MTMAKDQGARIITCSKHGISYDASKRGGCSRCIREWEHKKAKPQSSSTGIPTTVLLLGVLVVAAGLFFWFQGSSGSDDQAALPDEPARTSDISTATLASENALSQIIDKLPKVIRSGRSDTESYLADNSDPQRQKEDWEFWTMDWESQVKQLRDKLPEPPDSKVHMKLAVLFQDVSGALRELEAIPQAMTDGIPDEKRVGDRFRATEKAIQNAQQHLSQLH